MRSAALVVLLSAACSRVDPVPAPDTAPCWNPVTEDDLPEGLAGRTVVYRHADTSCGYGDGDLSGYQFRHYDAAERVDHESFDHPDGYRYDLRETWASDTCASSSVETMEYQGNTRMTTVTTRVCADGWPVSAVAEVDRIVNGEASGATGHSAWTYTWDGALPVVITSLHGGSEDTLEVSSTEERAYSYDGHLTHARTEDPEGHWGEHLYTWADDQLVAYSYANAYRTETTTWSYDDEGRVAGWELLGGPSGTYVYVEGTRRVAGEYVDRDPVDGVPDAYVGYTWLAGDLPGTL